MHKKKNKPDNSKTRVPKNPQLAQCDISNRCSKHSWIDLTHFETDASFFLFLSQKSEKKLATSTRTYTHSKYWGGEENLRTSTPAHKHHRHMPTTHLDRPIARRHFPDEKKNPT